MRKGLMLALLLLASCGGSSPTRDAESAPAGTSGYFPPALFHEPDGCAPFWWSKSNPVLSTFEDDWYSRHLRTAGERPLSFAPGGPDSVRFIWLRSFHSPVIVRVDWASTGEAVLTATMLSGAGGYEPGEISGIVSRTLTPDETRRLLALRPAAFRKQRADCRMMLDGASWIIEASGADGYRYVNSQSPRAGAVYDLGRTLLGFTGWALEPIY